MEVFGKGYGGGLLAGRAEGTGMAKGWVVGKDG